MKLRRRVVLALLICLSALTFPAAATAVVYEVNSTADEEDAAVGVAGCLTVGGKCTLRAAIQESNASTSVKDTIDFSAAFNGQLEDTITITLPSFPAISDEVTIDGDNGIPCDTEALEKGPCVGVNGLSLTAMSKDVEVKGLAITEAGVGIAVLDESTGFTATNNWLGVKLDGEPGYNNTGIFIDPGSDFASIGGAAEADRNVFAYNHNEGLDLEGASDAVIRGNFFGVGPDGATVAPNGKDIEITSSLADEGFPATGNEIGRTIEEGALATDTCDGGCNVISGAFSYGVDLSGGSGNETPAGPTTIHGNHIGLDVNGEGTAPNSEYGLLVGSADEVTIGGTSGADANYISGGTIGVVAGKAADDLVIQRNKIGYDDSGLHDLEPPAEGVNVSSEEVSGPTHKALITENMVEAFGIAITHHSFGADILDNDVVASTVGIRTYGFAGSQGNLIEGNTTSETTQHGILIENNANAVVNNLVVAAGEAGIRVRRFLAIGTSGNLIGGLAEDEENAIFESGGPAIEIENFEETNNEVGRNWGSENAGLFIDLIPAEPGLEPNGPNEGVKPPTSFIATQSKAEGTAEPGALVRVFRKVSAEPGELQSFLGETEADGSGNWEVGYASIPEGTIVAATQTNVNGGTSELATTTTGEFAVDKECDVKPCDEDGSGSVSGGGTTPVSDTTPPTTTITKAPKAKTTSTTAKFKFKSNEAGSRFECKLDKAKFKKCRSPKTYKKLKPGKHVFKVRAVDRAGNVGKPAKRKFTVA